MAKFNSSYQLIDSLSAPFGDLVSSIGISVADAQKALDAQAIENFMAIYGEGEEALKELKKIGYQPTWYNLPETTAELKIALTISGESASTSAKSSGKSKKKKKLKLYAAPVDGGYTGKYNYDLRASAKITFKIVPIPPPAAASEMAIAPDLLTKQTTVEEARKLLLMLGINHSFSGPGNTIQEEGIIKNQVPASGELITGGFSMILDVQNVAPDFLSTETTAAKARELLDAYGIEFTIEAVTGATVSDESIVDAQTPLPGEVIPDAGEIVITVR